METLYADASFAVNLWRLPSREAISLDSDRRGQWLIITGQLAWSDAATSGQTASAGAHLQNPLRLENPGAEPSILLELSWQKPQTPRPLQEVTETRPWGSFTVLKDEPTFKLKQLMVNPGNRLSLQRHQKREEHWLVTAGKPEVTLDERVLSLPAGSYIHIPRQAWHRITNPAHTGEAVEIIELQLGEYFGEDDIERREDDYGRC